MVTGTMMINKAELSKMLKDGYNVTVIDVRNRKEFEEMHVPFAINIPIEEIESGETTLDTKGIIVTVCGKGGGRSERAADFIRKNLQGEAYFLDGGTFGWFEKG